MVQEFFFYDYECSGLNPALSRILQFAGVRTDADFEPISEPIVLYCQPTDDYLPSPKAINISGITPQKCLQQGIPEPEFARRILQAFGQNTCILGYNNLRYDDKFTRFLFYRNFIPAYQYSYNHGNSLWDLIDLVRACYALRPEGINWLKNAAGEVSCKLEDLTKTNDIMHENPHEALSDVWSTIAMAKLIKAKQPKLFEYYFAHRNKYDILQPSLLDLSNPQILVHVSGMFGHVQHYAQLVLPIIVHPKNKNSVIVAKLNEHCEDLLSESVENLHQRLYTTREDLQQQGLAPVSLKEVRLNRCPFLAPTNVMHTDTLNRLNWDLSVCDSRANKLREHWNTLVNKVTQIYAMPRPSCPENSPHLDVEARLYDGFIPFEDEHKLAQVHKGEPSELANIEFSDARLQQLLFRYRARHFKHTLSHEEQQAWANYRKEKLQNMAVDFWEQLTELEEEPSSDTQNICQELRDYAHQLLTKP